MNKESLNKFRQKPYKITAPNNPMAQDNKIRMPSSQGGLTRYFDEYSSKIDISPTTVVILALVVMVLVIILHSVGGQIFN